MITVYKKLLDFLDTRERRRFYLLMALMVVVTFAEIMGISMVLLLLRVLSQPEQIQTNATLSWAYARFGFTSTFSFQVALSAGVFVVVMLGLVIKGLGNYAFIRFSTMRGYSLSSRLMQVYLRQPYTWFLSKNSSDISKSVLSEVDQLIMRLMIPAIKLLANALLALAIVLFLMAVDPLISITAAVLMGGAYLLIYLRLRTVLVKIGRDLLQANKEKFRLTSEAIGGFKEVKLMNLEDSYIRRFNGPARRRAHLGALNQILGELPRFALEGISFGVLLAMILIMLVRSGGDFAASVPTLGIVALSVMRLLPALQQVYGSFSSLRSGAALLENLHGEYTQAMQHAERPDPGAKGSDRIELREELVLDDVSFCYPSANRAALHGLDLRVRACTTIGIVGGTGAGKTTLVDIVLGLLMPDAGTLSVDGTPITRANRSAWQRSLGYVPQSIYLVDDTISANIAFGAPAGKINAAAVERAARVAALHDFVMNELPNGYDTIVGERGVRLSGGQRQRIGIARALYHNPSVLILDEATSALDNITERVVMEAVQNLQGEKTVILIAHRLSTVQHCDAIFLMERGRVAAVGTYDELVRGNETFRRMVNG